MRCRVDNNLRAVFIKHTRQCFFVGNGTDLDLQVDFVPVGDFQLLLNIVSAIFVDVQNDNLPGGHLRQLSAQLRADGTAAAGDQNDLVPVIGVGLIVEDRNRFAKQQLLNVKVPEIPLFSCGLHHGIVVDLDLIARLGIGGEEDAFFLVRQIGDGEHHLLHLMLLQCFHSGLIFQQHRNAMDRTPGLLGVDVDEAPGDVGGGSVCQQLLRQRNADTARADDGNFYLVLRFVVGVDQLLPGENP